MGFKRSAKIYKLVFDDPELEGLEVRARSLSIGEMRRLSANQQDADDNTVTEMLAAFVKALVDWNLEDEDGNPVPHTVAALEEFPDNDFVLGMINTWIDAVIGVDAELGKDSPSGEPFPEGSIPMEPLSPSLAS